MWKFWQMQSSKFFEPTIVKNLISEHLMEMANFTVSVMIQGYHVYKEITVLELA